MGGLKQLSFTKKIVLTLLVGFLFFIFELLVVTVLVVLHGVELSDNMMPLLFLGNPQLFSAVFVFSAFFALLVGVIFGLWLKPNRLVNEMDKKISRN